MKKELDLLEEFLIQEEKKRKRNDLPQEEKLDTIESRIRYLRKTEKLTQKDFAHRVLISQSYVSGIENGSEIPTDKLLKLICLEFGIKESWLIDGNGKMYGEAYEKEVDDRIDSLIRIAKIVNSAEKKLPDESREGLSYVAERLLNESASAHLEVDADGQIEMTVLDRIFEPKVLAKLQMQKAGSSLFITDFNFCQYTTKEACADEEWKETNIGTEKVPADEGTGSGGMAGG